MGEGVLHLLEARRHSLAIVGDGGVIGSLGEADLGATLAGIEQRGGELRADGPEAVGPGEEVDNRRGLQTGGGAEDQGWEEGGATDPDLLIGGGDLAFGGSDIGAALEQGRRDGGRDGRRRHLMRCIGQGQIGWRLADQHGDGVLELGALYAELDGLGARGFELSLRERHIALRGDAAIEAVLGELRIPLVRSYGGVEQVTRGVEALDREVVGGEL